MKKNAISSRCRVVPSHVRVLIFGGILLLVIGCLSLYNYYSLRGAENITAVDSLSGQRIACCVGWESDYLLTPRKDLTLLRYDTNADCILALSFGQIDAVAMDEITLITVLSKTQGLEVLPDPITAVGCTFLASYGAEDKLAEFNEYAEQFVQSEDYHTLHDNLFSEEYRMADIPELTDGKVLNVGYFPESYPEAYIDFTTGEPAGYGIEMIKRFAYDRGYTVNWIETSETGAMVQLSLNQIDFAVCYTSDVYREEYETGGEVHMTAAYLYTDVYLVKIADGEKLKITGEIEY